MQYKIIEIDENNYSESGPRYFWNKWGGEKNYNFYKDAIDNSYKTEKSIPRFYLMINQDKIIGCVALIINDLISRQDLYPWLAALYIDEKYRGKKLGIQLIEYCVNQAKVKGYKSIYLCTSHDNYYEKYGWNYKCDAYLVEGKKVKVYEYLL